MYILFSIEIMSLNSWENLVDREIGQVSKLMEIRMDLKTAVCFQFLMIFYKKYW